ncbi:MAG TPA: hypothetical protein PKM72_11975, partial [Nitrospirales bacterium]|nr:hypothetical protein [Nitrospirales bacterium]
MANATWNPEKRKLLFANLFGGESCVGFFHHELAQMSDRRFPLCREEIAELTFGSIAFFAYRLSKPLFPTQPRFLT